MPKHSKLKRTNPDDLLKVYYRIMRDLGPDPVLEERIEREEHRLDEKHLIAKAG